MIRALLLSSPVVWLADLGVALRRRQVAEWLGGSMLEPSPALRETPTVEVLTNLKHEN
jgi:hypothetical protein